VEEEGDEDTSRARCAARAGLGGDGCPKENKDQKKETPTAGKDEKKQPGPGALPADADYVSGNVAAAVMEVQTKLDVAGMGPEGEPGAEVKKAQESSVTNPDHRRQREPRQDGVQHAGLLRAEGTELRYNPAHKKYVLADTTKKQYWAMTGAEIGNLLEGGPSMTRANYTIKVTPTEEKRPSPRSRR